MTTLDDIKILREFLGKKGIDFVLTGTMGLYVHGLLPEGYEPNDIDIIVFVSDATKNYIDKELRAVETLTGGSSASEESYPDRCFTFYVGPNNTKVNAMYTLVNDAITYIELTFGKTTLKLHSVNEILNAKFKIRRQEDYVFCNKLITTLLSYFKK